MPRTSLKYRVSREVTELLGVSILFDLCFNDSSNDNPEVTSDLIRAVSGRAWETNNEEGEPELVTAEVQELCEVLLVALPNIRYLAPRVSLTRGLGFWSNVSIVDDSRYVISMDIGKQVANLWVVIII